MSSFSLHTRVVDHKTFFSPGLGNVMCFSRGVVPILPGLTPPHLTNYNREKGAEMKVKSHTQALETSSAEQNRWEISFINKK